MNSKKLLNILGATGVVVHAGMTALPASAASHVELEQLLQSAPASHAAGDAFDQLASRFKEKGEKGRPGSFGAPGKPDIGPPGHYAG